MSRKIVLSKNLVLFGSAVVTVAAILHTYQLVLETRIAEEAHPFHADLFPGRLHLFLLLAFLVIAAGLIIGKRAGLVCSLLGLICVFVGHVGWFHYSHAVLYAMNQDERYAGHPELIPPNIWGFIGARWWDVVLLILFMALFVWEIKVLFTRAEKRNRNEVGS